MRETQFIQQNEEKWAYYEDLLAHQQVSPDALQEMFVQITDDLSFARTFYPSRSVRAYLNGLGQKIFALVYRRKRRNAWQRIKLFFTDELPQVIYQSHSMFFWAAVLFVLSFAIGYFSSMMDENFSRLILGDDYVRMTTENIRSHDPMAVYKEKGHYDMTFGIMLHNMWVTYFYFILGVFAGVGSVAMMMYNGVMVGAFLQFFARAGLAREANLTIWMHGTFEISAIIIGTAAGMTMGSGLLFPQTYTRLQAFQMSSRRGIKIMMGVTILLFFAAIFEGNLTRYTQLGDLFRTTFILLCLLLVLGYYVWYPRYKAKVGFLTPLKEVDLPPTRTQVTEFGIIKTTGEIFYDTFNMLSRHLSFYLSTAFGGAAIFVLGANFWAKSGEDSESLFYPIDNLFSFYSSIYQCFSETNFNTIRLALLLSTIFGTSILLVLRRLTKEEFDTHQVNIRRFLVSKPAVVLFFASMIAFVYLAIQTHSLIFIFLMFGVPLLGMIFTAWLRDDCTVGQSVGVGFRLYFAYFGRVVGPNLLCFLLLIFAYSALNSGLVWFYLQIFSWNFHFSDNGMGIFQSYTIGILTMSLFLMMLMLLFTAAYFVYTSVNEIEYAETLLARIETIGSERKIQGLAREGRR